MTIDNAHVVRRLTALGFRPNEWAEQYEADNARVYLDDEGCWVVCADTPARVIRWRATFGHGCPTAVLFAAVDAALKGE